MKPNLKSPSVKSIKPQNGLPPERHVKSSLTLTRPSSDERRHKLLSAAKSYASSGWAVLPVHYLVKGSCSCSAGAMCTKAGKHPATRNGSKDATRDRATIERWWKEKPFNIGVATGAVSDLIVLDIDPANGGLESRRKVKDLGGFGGPKVHSGGGGRHYYLRLGGVHVPTSQGRLGRGIDVLSSGSYVIAPPSRHRSGKAYQWAEGRSSTERKLPVIPAALRQRCMKAPAVHPSLIPEGTRNNTLASIGGRMRAGGAERGPIEKTLHATNEAQCDPPLPQQEVARIASSVAKYPAGTSEDDATQIVRAMLQVQFADGAHLRLGDDEHLWEFAQTHWRQLSMVELDGRVLRLLDDHPGRFKGSPNSLIRSVTSLLRSRCSASGQLLRFGEAPLPVINVENGELWIGGEGDVELRPHRAESMQLSVSPVRYDPAARCPAYDRAVSEIFGAARECESLASFFHMVCGYALQPSRRTPLVVICKGSGANGKTRLINTLLRILGSGSVVAVQIQDLDSNRFLPGQLLGKRVVIDDDVKAGIRLPDGALKRFSEDKLITGEHKFSRHFSFTSRVLPIMLCNSQLSMADISHGMRRRLVVIPFAKTFSGANDDKTLFERIHANELSGVLNRYLAGLAALIRNGWTFDAPIDVQRETRAFLREANPVPEFVASMCTAEGRTPVQVLYQSFVTWAKDAGFTHVQQRGSFGRRLEDCGIEVKRTKVGAVAMNLSLKADR